MGLLDKLTNAAQSVEHAIGIGNAAPEKAPSLSQVADKTLGAKVADSGPPPLRNLPLPGKDEAPNYSGSNGGGDASMDWGVGKCLIHPGQQPLVADGGPWDGQRILDAQSQLSDTAAEKGQMEHRCAPSCIVAKAVMQGQGATSDLAGKVAGLYPDGADKQHLLDIQQRIQNGSATHDDLSHLQESIYDHYATKGQNMTPEQVEKMQQELGGQVSVEPEGTSGVGDDTRSVQKNNILETPNETRDRVGSLKPGESFMMAVNTDFKDREECDKDGVCIGFPANHDSVNHAVLVGKDANGRVYLYDPYPKTNQPPIIYQQQYPQAFATYTDGTMGADCTVDDKTVRMNILNRGTMK